jgi:hypothetical protein
LTNEDFHASDISGAMNAIANHIKGQSNGHFALTFQTLDNALNELAPQYAEKMNCDEEEARRLLHQHFMMRMRSGSMEPEIDENIASLGTAGEVNDVGAVVEAQPPRRPKLIRKHYYEVSSLGKSELDQLKMRHDENGWFLPEYDTSGSGFINAKSSLSRAGCRFIKVLPA